MIKWCILPVLFLVMIGCTNVSITTQQDIGAPIYPPTDPASVQIVRAFPTRPFVRLGEITAEPYGDPSVQEIEQKLRDGAAKIGASTAVIVSDRTELMGASITGGFGNRQLSRDYQRVIMAIGIRYVH